MSIDTIETALAERDEAIRVDLKALETKNAKLEEKNSGLVDRIVHLEQLDSNFIPDLKKAPDYSIQKVMRHLADPRNKLDGYEAEMHQELMQKGGINRPNAVMIPLAHKSMHYSTASPDLQASNLVATETGEMIDILREESIVMGLGATTFNAVGDVNVPRKASGTTAYWFGADDGDSITESDFNFDEILIRPKYVAALTKASYRMLSQTSGTNNAVDSMIERHLMAVLAEALDNAAINGTGSNSQPTGIINQSNILTDTWTGSPSVYLWDDVLEMERLLIANKSLRGNLGALVDPDTYKATKATVKSSGDGLGFLSEDGMLNGYPYRATTHMPANSVLFGNWQDLLIATFGGLSLEVAQPGADFAKGTTSFRAILGTDIAVRHPESFVLSTKS